MKLYKKLCLGLLCVLLCGFSYKTSIQASNFDTAERLSTNATVNGSLTETEKSMFYKVTLPSAGALSIQTIFHFNEIGIAIYDDQMAPVCGKTYYWDSSSQTGVETSVYHLDQGTYYIRIIGNYWYSDRGYYTGDYRLVLKYTSAGVNHSENNNSFDTASAISLGQTYYGQMARNNGVDYYKISLPSAGCLTIPLTFKFDRIGLRIYNENFSPLTEDTFYWDDASETGVRSAKYWLDKGTYYIRVIGAYATYTSCEYFGNYYFSTSFVSGGVNHNEPNNSFETASPISGSNLIKGQISLNNEVDYYRLSIPVSGKTGIRVVTTMNCLGLRLYDSSFQEISNAYMNINRYSDTDSTIHTEELSLSAGTYYVRVIGNSASSSYSSYYGRYTLSFSNAGFPSTPTATAQKPGRPTLKSVKSKKARTVTVTWASASNADGYKIVLATNSKFTSDKRIVYVKSQKAKSKKIGNLKRRKTYYVKMYAYKLKNGKKVLGKQSNKKKVTVK